MGSKRQVVASSNTSYVAGGNFPTFGVMIPQESGIRAGGSINDNQPKKDLGNLLKVPNVASWGCSDIFQKKNHSGGMHFKEFIGVFVV